MKRHIEIFLPVMCSLKICGVNKMGSVVLRIRLSMTESNATSRIPQLHFNFCHSLVFIIKFIVLLA